MGFCVASPYTGKISNLQTAQCPEKGGKKNAPNWNPGF
jgi:hypothetical protein